MRKIASLLLLGVLWTSSSFGQNIGGPYRNSTGTNRDTLYFEGHHLDSLALLPQDGDSIIFVRYRGKTLVDSTAVAFSTDKWSATGEFVHAFKAADASGNDGIYRLRVFVWKNGNRSTTTRAFDRSYYYEVLADAKQDTILDNTALTETNLDAAVTSRMATYTQPTGFLAATFPTGTIANTTNITAGTITTATNLTNEARIVSAETLSVLTNEARVVSTDTLTTILGNVNGSVASVTNRVTANTDQWGGVAVGGMPMPRTDTSTIRGNIVDQKIKVNANGVVDTVRGSTNPVAVSGTVTVGTNNDKTGYTTTAADKQAVRDTVMHFLQFGPILKNPSFELNDSVSRDMTITGWLAGTAGTDSSQTSANAYVGKYSVLLNGRSSTLKSDSMALGGGHRYKFGAWVWWDGANVPLINFRRGGTQVVPLPIQPIVATLRQWQWVDTTFLVATAGIHHVEILAGSGAGDSLFVDGIMLDRIPDSLGAAGSTDTTAIKTMMTNNRFARHRTSPGNPNDTVNAVASLQSLGAGPYTERIFTLDSATGGAVEGYNISIRDSATQTQYTQAYSTNSSGYVEFNVTGSTTYFGRGSKAFYRFATNADTTFNVAAANHTDTTRVVGITLASPPAGGQVSITGTIVDVKGDTLQGATITFTLNQLCFFSSDDTTNLVAVAQEASATSGANGQFTISIYPTTKLIGSDRRMAPKYAITVILPDGTSTQYTDFVWTFSHTPGSQKLNWNLIRWKSE